MKRFPILFLFVILLLAGCAGKQPESAGSDKQKSQEKTEKITEAEEILPGDAKTDNAETDNAETDSTDTDSTNTDSVITENIEITEEIEEMEANAIRPTASLVMEVNGRIYYPDLADNSSAEAFFEKLEEGRLVVDLHDYGNFEKVGPLPWDLPRNDEKITTVPGDIILYQGNQITVYYDENTWEFTRLARIYDVTKEELLDVLGEDDVTVSFWLEWSE